MRRIDWIIFVAGSGAALMAGAAFVIFQEKLIAYYFAALGFALIIGAFSRLFLSTNNLSRGFGALVFAILSLIIYVNRASLTPRLPEASGEVFDFNVASGQSVHGIKWEPSFAHVQLQFANTSDSEMKDVEIYMETDRPIAAASVEQNIGPCQIRGLEPAPGPLWVRGIVNGKEETIEPQPVPGVSPIDIQRVYRMSCDRIPPHSVVVVTLATAREVPAITHVPNVFSGQPVDPKTATVREQATVDGQGVVAIKTISLAVAA